jgi:hypothetical protein
MRVRRPRSRQPGVKLRLLWETCCLLLGMTVCAAAMADPPPAQPAPPTPSQGQHAPPPQATPDDDFIEFLGTDDVGDAAWWEFLNKVPPRGDNPPAPPPQDAKQ